MGKQRAKAKPSRGPGRPPTLTAALSSRIATLLRQGVFVEHAAESVGVSRQVVYQWLERGRIPPGDAGYSPLHARFLDTVTRARAAAVVDHVRNVHAASREPAAEARAARHSEWALERLAPRQYGLKVRVTVAEELDEYLEALRNALPPRWYEVALEVAARLGDDSPGATAGLEADEAGAPTVGLPGADSLAAGEGVRAAAAPAAGGDAAGAHQSG